MSVDTIVRYIELNVGDIADDDSRITKLFTHPDSGDDVYGIEFPFHKPNRSIKITGRERVGRDKDAEGDWQIQAGWVPGSHPPASAFHPSPPLGAGQDEQTTEGCAVSAVEDVGLEGSNFVQLAFIAYDPAAPTVGICVAWLNVISPNDIKRARFTDMNVVEENKYVSRQSNITLVALAGLTNQENIKPGSQRVWSGLSITGLTGQLEYEIFQ